MKGLEAGRRSFRGLDIILQAYLPVGLCHAHGSVDPMWGEGSSVGMVLEVYSYRVEGVSSLLMHSPKAMMEDGPSGSSVKRIPSREEEAEKGTYRDEEGCLYLPSAAFRASLMHGAGGRRIGRTAARTVLAGAVFATGSRTSLLDPESGERLRHYRVHIARVVIQRNSIVRARPELERWGCVLDLEMDLDFTNAWQVEELLNVAGRISGVGDFRPERRGPHGRYRVELLEDHSRDASVPGTG